MLHRIPVKGDYVRLDVGGHVYPVFETWAKGRFQRNKSHYTFVEVTEVEPPEKEGNYYNLHMALDGSKVCVGGVSGYRTRKEADRMCQADTRVACVDLNLLKGRFDE